MAGSGVSSSVGPVSGRFSLDTNILVYSADSSAGERHRDARALLWRASDSDCVLVLQAVAEFYRVVTRKDLAAAATARAVVDRMLELFFVASATGIQLRDAILAVEQHQLSFWDAMLWATARGAGCSVLLTEDMQDGRELGGVTFVNPFRPRNRPLVEALLRG